MTARECPICGSYQPTLIYRQRFAVEDDGRRIAGYDVVACEKCGAVYADDIPSQRALDGYYAAASKYEYLERCGEPPAALDESHRQMVEQLLPLLPDRSTRIVDVGCGNGDVLGLLRRAGFPDVLGVDPAEHSAAAARRLHGVEVVSGGLLALPKGVGPAGCVLLSAVLEHVREVADALRGVSELLAADGLLYVEVPDLERFASPGSLPFQQFSVEHINYFSAASLTRAAAGAGLGLSKTWPALRHTGSVSEPVVCSVFRPDRAAPERSAARDHDGPPAARRYVALSQARENDVLERCKRLTAGGRPLIVWGAGTYMQHLFARPPLAGADLVAVVDANPRMHGVSMAGHLVTGPEALAGRPEPILIGAPAYEREIVDMARRVYGLRNELYSVFGPLDPP